MRGRVEGIFYEFAPNIATKPEENRPATDNLYTVVYTGILRWKIIIK